MHELSIVTYVVKQVQEIAKENNLTEIESVTLEFGEVSGIVPEYLEDCWNWYTKKEPIIQGTKLPRPYNTARPARTAATATPGCSRAMRSISNRSRRVDSGTPPCLWAAKETEAVAQPLLIETRTKRE